MESPSSQPEQPMPDASQRPRAGVFYWILTHRPSRLIVPPLVLVCLLSSLTVPLLNDLRLLSKDGLTLVEQVPPASDHDGHLIVDVKNINPNNGIATLDVTYVTDNLDNAKVELWIASGGVTLKGGKLLYEMNTELSRVPIVMDSPTIFVWGDTKRATFKQSSQVKIDRRTQGYFCPFDRYVIEFSFALSDKSEKILHPKLWCELEDPHFVNAHPTPLQSHGEKAVTVPNSLTVTLDRPMYEKIFLGLSLLMGLGCVLWALYKITYTSITAMESLSLLAFDFTVLMAVPALRGVFVPSNLQYAPLFDFFVVLIWTVGLLTLSVNIFRHDILIRTRKTPPRSARPTRCCSSPKDATRQIARKAPCPPCRGLSHTDSSPMPLINASGALCKRRSILSLALIPRRA